MGVLRALPALLALASACGLPVEDPGYVHGSVNGHGLEVRDSVALRIKGDDSTRPIILLSDRPWLCSRLQRGEQLKQETMLYLGASLSAGTGSLLVPVQLTPQLETLTATFTPLDDACQPLLAEQYRKVAEGSQYPVPPPDALESKAFSGKFQYAFGPGEGETLVGSYTARFCDVDPEVLAASVCP